MELRVLNAEEMSRALDMAELIEGMKLAYRRLSAGQAEMPLRSRITLPRQEGVLLTMPAALPREGKLAVKMVSVFGKNPGRQLPLIHALVTVFDAETGAPAALMDGEVLTAKRTGAGSGVATDLLADKEASEVAILGSGAQARTQLEAVCSVRNIKKARVYSPNNKHAIKFAEAVQDFIARVAGDGYPLKDVTTKLRKELEEAGLKIGFKHVAAGPLVRSSYHAHEQAEAFIAARPSHASAS